CCTRWACLVGEQVSRGCALPRASRSLGRGSLSPVAIEVERRGRPLSSLAVGGPVLHSVSSSTCPPSRRCLVASDPTGESPVMEGFLMSNNLYRRFSDRLEAPEPLPEGLDVPELREAHGAAMEAYLAVDDVISEKDAYEVLVVDDIDEWAEEKDLRALRAGDKAAKVEGDRLRKLRAETVGRAEQARQERTRTRRAYEKLLKEYALEIAKLAARRLEDAETSVVEAEAAFREAYRQYQHAVARMEDAVHRAGLVPVVNVRQIRGKI